MKPVGHLLRRREFVALTNNGRKWVAPGMIVQFLPRTTFSNPSLLTDDSLTNTVQTSAVIKSLDPEATFAENPSSPSTEHCHPCAKVRYGLTASKKIGNAVIRNRVRRRLRAVAEEILPHAQLPPCDVVIIARPKITLTRSFDDLKQDLRWSLSRLKNKAAL